MIINDKARMSKIGKSNFPVLKGHVKITLKNVHNGKTEIVEGENIVTNAVKDIFEANYLGGIDYSKMMPLWSKWFGGVLAFEKAHANLDADKYYPESDSNNHLVAHAGQAGIDVLHDDDMRAGNPLPASFIPTANSMKMVWEWGTTHGNGTIRALSLCHTDIGDSGIGGTNYRFQNLNPFDIINGSQLSNINSSLSADDNLVAQYDDRHGIGFVIGDGTSSGSEGWYADHTRFQTDKITFFIRKLPYAKAGLFETLSTVSADEKKVTIDNLPFDLFCEPCFYFEPSTKYLWIFSNVTGLTGSYGQEVSWDNQNVNYFKIDTVNNELVDLGSGVYYKTLQSDTNDLAPICYIRRDTSNNYRFASILVENGYAYFPSTSGVDWGSFDYGEDMHINKFKKIKISNNANTSFSLTQEMNHLKPMVKNGDLILASGMVVNDSGYPCVNQLETIYGAWCFQQLDKPSMLVIPNRSSGNAVSTARYILASKFVLCSKFNLNSAITKAANQAMTIEYTLTET